MHGQLNIMYGGRSGAQSQFFAVRNSRLSSSIFFLEPSCMDKGNDLGESTT